jgi:hypothetical protein
MGGIAVYILQVRARGCRPRANPFLTLDRFQTAKQFSSASSRSRHPLLWYLIRRRFA